MFKKICLLFVRLQKLPSAVKYDSYLNTPNYFFSILKSNPLSRTELKPITL